MFGAVVAAHWLRRRAAGETHVRHHTINRHTANSLWLVGGHETYEASVYVSVDLQHIEPADGSTVARLSDRQYRLISNDLETQRVVSCVCYCSSS